MRTPEDILLAQAKYNDILLQTELSALPEGYIAGGGISISNTDVFIDPLIANIRGKRITKSTSTNIADMFGSTLKVNDTYYYIYLNNFGFWSITVNPPTAIDGLYGLYQKESNERFVGAVYVDTDGAFLKVVSHMRVRAEDMDFGTITAEEIAAGTITADKLVIGIKGTAYNQPLAPNLVFLGDTWIDTDTDLFHKAFGGDISTSKGGADSSVTSFDKVYGGTDSSVTVFDNTYGNIDSSSGWILGGLAAGTTKIDGGQIETDTLKSANFVTGVSGSKFDLATGYIETGSGVFRGDVEIGSDDADRQLELGSKGLLVKDSLGNIIHDLPNAPTTTGGNSLGHLIMFDGTDSSYSIYDEDPAVLTTWTAVVCKLFNSTNVKGALFKIDLLGANYSVPVSYVEARILLRPKGSTWSSSAGLAPELRSKTGLAGGSAFTFIEHSGMLSCPVGEDSSVEFNASLRPVGSQSRVKIVQIGVYI